MSAFIAVCRDEALVFDNHADAWSHYNEMSRPCGVFVQNNIKEVWATNLSAEAWVEDEETGYTETQVLEIQLAEIGYTEVKY